jgi:hypothetical protein
MQLGTRRTRWSAAALVAVLALTSVSAGADPSDADLRSERERLRAEQAQVAGTVDVAQADLEEVTRALADIEANVRLQESQLEQAEAAVVQADQEVAEALAAQAATEAEVAELREVMAAIAVDAYVSPPETDTLEVMLEGDLGSAPERQALLDIRASDTSDVLERFRAAQEDLEIQARTAEEAATRAEQGRAEVAERLQSVQAARDVQSQLAAEANLRLHEMREQLAALDEGADQIDAELARREEARLAELQRQLDEANARRGPVSLPDGGSVDLVRVRGIVVAASIADQLAAMVDAAAADGVTLTGGGYRDSSSQIALRRAHCGTSQYAIYEMSPSQCSPPTARPGQSNHERGLAIDFNNCSTRSSECFRWLAANASSFGFQNLPSEPWHWSTNGQ